MSVYVSGPKIGEMKVDTTGLNRTECKAIEASIRQRGFRCTIIPSYNCLTVFINVGTLRTNDLRKALTKIDRSVARAVQHKVTQKKALAVTA